MRLARRTVARPRRLLIAVLGLALAPAACDSAGPVDDPEPIKPGVCVTDETRDQGHLVPDLSSVVDCSKPHVYEVYDIIDLPRDMLSRSSARQDRIDNRDE